MSLPDTQADTPFRIDERSHLEASERLRNDCVEVQFCVHSLPTSKKLDDDRKSQVAQELEMNEQNLSASKRIWPADHPLIKQINACTQQIGHWRDSYTLPMAAFTTEAGVKNGFAKAAGKRLIAVADVDDFEAGLTRLAKALDNATTELERDYEKVLAEAAQRLGPQFSVKDYPDRGSLAARIGLSERRYTDCQISLKLSPGIRARMERQWRELMSSSLEIAVTDLAKTFSDTFSTLAKQLADRIRIEPRHSHPLRRLAQELEVLEIKRHGDDQTIPEGSMMLHLTWKQGRQTVKEWHGPYTEEEYAALRPSAMEKTKRISTSVIDTLFEHLDVFERMRERLGPYGEALADPIAELEAVIGMSGQSVDYVIDRVKRSDSYREDLRDELGRVCGALAETATEASEIRRRLSMRQIDLGE